MSSENPQITGEQVAHAYYQKKNVNQILESIVTGLTFNQPEDPLEYIDKCVNQIRNSGSSIDKLRWDNFVTKELDTRTFARNADTEKIGNHPKIALSPFRGGLTSQTRGILPLITKIHALSNKTSLSKISVLPPIPNEVEVIPNELQPTESTVSISQKKPLPQIGPSSESIQVEEVKVIVEDTPAKETVIEKKLEIKAPIGKAWENVVFVLGGPGSGKGTNCEKLAKEFHYAHLSAGDLLRAEVATGSELGKELDGLMKEGKIVSTEITLGLLREAMLKAPENSEGFLIDGFPRQLDQAEAFEKNITKCKFVLYFECPKETLQERLLIRGQTSGRADDNLETITKRFDTFINTSLPVIKQYEEMGKCIKISTVSTPEEVYANVRQYFVPPSVKGKAWENIVFAIGGPGSGKKKQCDRIAKEYSYNRISFGDLLLSEVSKSSELGLELEGMMKEGSAIPIDISLGLLKDEMTRLSNNARGFLIDGFPTHTNEAEAFEVKIAPSKFLLHFDCSESTMEKRILKRLESGMENEQVLKDRIHSFAETFSPVIATFKQAGKSVTVSSEGTIEEVYENARQYFVDPRERGVSWNNIVLVLGGPGSGKGTQCEKLAKEFNYCHLSSGDLLRAEVATGSKHGKELEQIMQEGKMVPLDITLGLLRDAMMKAPSDCKGFLIDGFPRELIQAKAFEATVAPCKFVLFFACPEEELFNRLVNRGKTSGRADDNVETINKRLKVFNELSRPITEAFKKQGKLVTIQSNNSVDDVYKQTREYFVGIDARPPSWRNILFVLGGPGSGKGTQSSHLAEEFKYTHLSSGDLLREVVQSGSKEVLELDALMKEGKMVPVEVTLNLLRKAMLNAPESSTGFLIDGFPRTLDQAKLFENIIAPCKLALFFDCPISVLQERLLKRGETSGRTDDNMESIQKRFQTFADMSMPVVNFYKDFGKLVEISSVDAPEIVYSKLKESFLDVSMLGEAWKHIVFVLGGPGSGKGTQCARISKEYNYTHLSAGDLLRAEVSTGSELGIKLDELMKEGKIVSTEITLGLLRAAMLKAPADTKGFLIDGFPRELRQARLFEATICPCERVLVFDCPEDIMVERLLERGKTSGRSDDNGETIRKRFKTFQETSLPVITEFKASGKCTIISSVDSPDNVFESVKQLFQPKI